MVQVKANKPALKAPGTKRLKLKCDILLSTSAFKTNLRRYSMCCTGVLYFTDDGNFNSRLKQYCNSEPADVEAFGTVYKGSPIHPWMEYQSHTLFNGGQGDSRVPA